MLPRLLLLLGYADATDYSEANLQLVVKSIGIAAAIAVLAGALVILARRRWHRHLELVGAIALLWAVVASYSGISAVNAREKWSREQMVHLKSGYVDDLGVGEPALPWLMWIGMGVGYVGLVGWAVLGPARIEGGEDQTGVGTGRTL